MIRILIEIDGVIKIDQRFETGTMLTGIDQMAKKAIAGMNKLETASKMEKFVNEPEHAKQVTKKHKTCACGAEFIPTGNRQVKCRKDCTGKLDEVLAEIEANKKKPYDIGG